PMTEDDSDEGEESGEGEVSDEEQTAEDVIEEVRKMHPGGDADEGATDEYVEGSSGDGEEKKSALDEPLDLDEI
ncbi:hypothetical protein GOV10_01500, partial [Candidatus Woesearchaeota archaeon]|nr:hypothetical protein [Candidatus Woesearchaeota archaeon]